MPIAQGRTTGSPTVHEGRPALLADVTSSLGKVRRRVDGSAGTAGSSSDPLVGELRQISVELTDQGIRLGRHIDGSRPGLKPSHRQLIVLEIRRGLPDIHFRAGRRVQWSFLCEPPSGGVVETRRLELLTLSLQRRCSPN